MKLFRNLSRGVEIMEDVDKFDNIQDWRFTFTVKESSAGRHGHPTARCHLYIGPVQLRSAHVRHV